jgi:clan AA aspartic protease
VSARREPRIRLQVRRPDGTELTVTAVIDTGFTGLLMLPPRVITALGLTAESTTRFGLADGSERRLDVYPVEVLWGETWVEVPVSAVGKEAFVGMKLLLGHELRVAVVPGGAVEITPLP